MPIRGLIVHGGAGRWEARRLERAKPVLIRAVERGIEAFNESGDVVSACEEAVKVLEDSALFNAGTGSTLNIFGEVEMDASIMRGWDLEAGAVAAVRRIRNPISLARKVMEETDHVMLVGEGAERFARALGFQEYDPITPERLEKYRKYMQKLKEEGIDALPVRWKRLGELMKKYPHYFHGTVGCVAVDDAGKIVSASSTGGVFLKLEGRVGDTPQIGSGIYATEFAGASATGIGEGIARVVLSKRICDAVERGISIGEAVRMGIDYLTERVGLDAGVIALDVEGNVAHHSNTGTMPVSYYSNGKMGVEQG